MDIRLGRTFVLVNLFAALASNLFCEEFPKKVRLTLKPKAGASASYIYDSITDIQLPSFSGKGPGDLMTINEHQEYSDTVLEIDDKGIITKVFNVQVHTKDEKHSDKKMEKEMKKYAPSNDSYSLQGKSIGMKISPDGNIVESEPLLEVAPDETRGWKRVHGSIKLVMDDQMRQGFTNLVVAMTLPDKDLEVGDVWVTTRSMMGGTFVERYRLAGFENFRNLACAVIESTGIMTTNVEETIGTFFSNKDTKLVKDITGVGESKDLGKGGGKGDGRILLAYKEGFIASLESQSELTSVTPGMNGKFLETKSSYKTTLTLVEFKQPQ